MDPKEEQPAVDAIAEDAADAAKAATESATAFTTQVQDAASQLGDEASARADAATRYAGQQLSTAAEAIRGSRLHNGPASPIADRVALGFEQGGAYLSERGATGVVDTVTDLIRRYPWIFAVGVIGALFFLGRRLRR